jgi:hypothetical protein
MVYLAKTALVIMMISLGFEIGYAQDSSSFNSSTDSLVLVNFNESDLAVNKKMRLLEARAQNRISNAWDLKQFYAIDPKRFNRYMQKLDRELKKGKIKYKVISGPDNSVTGNHFCLTADFKIEESKRGEYLIIFMTAALLDKDGKRLRDGDATEIVKQLRRRK